jgi:hypothetical protein
VEKVQGAGLRMSTKNFLKLISFMAKTGNVSNSMWVPAVPHKHVLMLRSTLEDFEEQRTVKLWIRKM